MRLNFEVNEILRFHPISEQLLFDFSNFRCNRQLESSEAPKIDIRVMPISVKASSQILMPFFWQRPGGKIYGWFQNKVLKTNAGSEIHIDFQKWTIAIYLQGDEQKYEEFYLVVLSVLSERLEKLSWIRLHSAAAVIQGQSVLLNWPTGFGKSSCAFRLIQSHKAEIFCDETTWICKSQLQNFPTRFSLPIEANFSDRPIFGSKKFAFYPTQWSGSKAVDNLFFPLILNSQPMSWLWFFLSNTMGLGLAQMGPYYLRSHNFVFIVTVACRRLKCLFSLRKRVRFLKLKQHCPEQNLGLVLKTLFET